MSRAARRPLPVLGSPPPPGPARAADLADAGGEAGPVRVALVTLGCDKNTVDSERIASRLLGAGVELADDAEQADVVVVNTCGFIELAREESVTTLLDAARLKAEGQVRAVVGVGCLVQRYRQELEQEMPEIDLFLGLSDADHLVPELARLGLAARDTPLMERPLRALTATSGPVHTAHLKISEGCDHTCAFCAIPLMRGKFRSIPLDLLVREAQELERRGVVELNIVSQDTTSYGRDWARGGVPAPNAGDADGFFLGRPFAGMPNLDTAAPRPVLAGPADPAPVRPRRGDDPTISRRGALPLLLESLLSGTGIPWLRLFYMYPSGITRELVELMAREPRILPYLDMPVQHASDAVLQRMRRPERRATILERVAWLRDAIPDLALRTTVIVGFPGETEEDFEMLLDLLHEVRFDHLGAFAYSEEEDTAAAAMPDQVPEPVRRERLERLLEAQRGLSLDRNEDRVGSRVTVLVDEGTEDGVLARGPWQALEVDGQIRVEPGAGGAGASAPQPGELVEVVITGADELELTARLVP
jgi:ribosomal protein S12 methylthiotransferase